jgi:hypothetical protein
VIVLLVAYHELSCGGVALAVTPCYMQDSLLEYRVCTPGKDMESARETAGPVSGLDTVSLRGVETAVSNLYSLKDILEEFEILLFDIQDIGARYYMTRPPLTS